MQVPRASGTWVGIVRTPAMLLEQKQRGTPLATSIRLVYDHTQESFL